MIFYETLWFVFEDIFIYFAKEIFAYPKTELPSRNMNANFSVIFFKYKFIFCITKFCVIFSSYLVVSQKIIVWTIMAVNRNISKTLREGKKAPLLYTWRIFDELSLTYYVSCILFPMTGFTRDHNFCFKSIAFVD